MSRFHTGREEEWHSFYIVICNVQIGLRDSTPEQQESTRVFRSVKIRVCFYKTEPSCSTCSYCCDNHISHDLPHRPETAGFSVGLLNAS